MSHPSSQTNGGSLEDCHTNFFALTELCGIKWRRLKADQKYQSELLEDPVLVAYSKCIAADILCVWRKVPKGSSHNTGDGEAVSHPRELWVFWYGKDNDLDSILRPGLQDIEEGSYENGLTYDCRSLLFKALHNLIERCLLSRGFVRIGKWFVQPSATADAYLTFSFSFFVHGENRVCASIDVRHHSPVYRLNASHLTAAQGPHAGVQVILAPYGLAGTLTGQTFKESEASKLLQDWTNFYPLLSPYSNGTNIPPIVEVIVEYLLNENGKGQHLAERICQDSTLCTSMNSEASNDLPGQWDFGEPLGRNSCCCSKCRKKSSNKQNCSGTVPNSNNISPTSGGMTPTKGGKGRGGRSHPQSAATPFHRRSPTEDELTSAGMMDADMSEMMSTRLPSGYIGPSTPSFPCKSVGTPMSVGRGGQGGFNDPIPSVGSPASACTPHSQPPSVPPMLSPHPGGPLSNPPRTPATPNPSETQEVLGKTPDLTAPKSVSSVTNQVFSPFGGPPSQTDTKPEPPTDQGGPSWGGAMLTPPNRPQFACKRPFLPPKEYESFLAEDEERMSGMLYDYRHLDAWMRHPVKRFKREDLEVGKVPYPPVACKVEDTMGYCNSVATPPPPINLPNPEVKVKSECSDPYEFENEADVNLDGLKNKEKNKAALLTDEGLKAQYSDLEHIFEDSSPEEPTFQVTPPGSITPAGTIDEEVTTRLREKPAPGPAGGILNVAELSKMFPTPPSHEPPAHEHNPMPSPLLIEPPMPSPCTIDTQHLDLGFRTDFIKTEKVIQGTDEEVFVPVTLQSLVSSDKYAPLRTLPSDTLPPISSIPVYKPAPLPILEKSHVTSGPPSIVRHGLSPISPAPSLGHYPDNPSSHRTSGPPSQGPPVSYELQSPASNASSLQHQHPPPPMAHSLVLNVTLTDSMLNLFKDHNFDSCTVCVCVESSNGVGNLKGGDGALYLPDSAKDDEDVPECNCGFSAVINRKLSYQSGLFYEDEVDITGIRDYMYERRKPSLTSMLMQKDDKDSAILDSIPNAMLELVRVQSSTPLSACSLLSRWCQRLPAAGQSMNMLEWDDGNEVGYAAMLTAGSRPRHTVMHKWAYCQAKGPSSSQDIIRVMKTVQPLLQEAIQKKRSIGLWESPSEVEGPLTWRQFHRMASRGTEGHCGPQPIPTLLVGGGENEWISLSPFLLGNWERFMVEPYSSPRDIGYLVICPENEYVVTRAKHFFKQLSATYQMCRLGRHCPIAKVLRDGILQVGSSDAKKLNNEQVDEWFNALGDSPLATKLRLYAQAFRHHLSRLSDLPLDSSLLDQGSASIPTSQPSPVPPSSPAPTTPDDQGQPSSGSQTAESSKGGSDEDRVQPPAIVIYVIDPFTLGSDHADLYRLVCLAISRAFLATVSTLPENLQANIHLQPLPLDSIVRMTPELNTGRQNALLKEYAFSVFQQCRRLLSHSCNVRSLTGFGPAAAADLFLKKKSDKCVPAGGYKMFCPPWVLAPPKEKSAEDSLSNRGENGSILYCSYCLSEDLRWLLAVCTDDRGTLLESRIINIEIPNRTRRKKASARKIGLKKLMEWILSLMASGGTPWRLVVGRLGRMGHGELRGWICLLSKKYLMSATRYIRTECPQCLGVSSAGVLSACLVSLEPDTKLRLMADQFTPDERFGRTNSSLSTPQDATATHILVFPTSAKTQSSQAQFQQETNPLDSNLGNEEFLSMIGDGIGTDDLDLDAILNIGDEAVVDPNEEGSESGLSPNPPMTPQQRQDNGMLQGNDFPDPMEEAGATGNLNQQPLALGYYVSTAKTGKLPRWFWTSCPERENTCPSFLRSALHLHYSAAQSQSEDVLTQQTGPQANLHPLDSSYTADVLRYVLVGYNELSWLSLDPSTSDRRSCLPIHIQVLSQMYHTMAALV